jgi:CBS domain-containing protein
MRTAGDILRSKGNDVWSVDPNDKVLDALKLMAKRDVSAVLVLDQGRLAGILTERDYARKVVLEGRSSKEAKVSDVMVSQVVCVGPERSIEQCMGLMTDKRFRHLPVVEDERLIGVISIGDLVKAKIADQEFTISQLQSYIVG